MEQLRKERTGPVLVDVDQKVEVLAPRLNQEKDILAESIAEMVFSDPDGINASHDSEGRDTLPYDQLEIIEIYEAALLKAVGKEVSAKSTNYKPSAYLEHVVTTHGIPREVLDRPSMRAIVKGNDWGWVKDHCIN